MGNYGPQNSAAEKKSKIFHPLLHWIHFLYFEPADTDPKVQTQL